MIQRLLIRAGSGPLRPLGASVYRSIARAGAAYLRRQCPEASVYLTRGVAAGDVIPGVSDIDMAVVVPDDPSGRLSEHDRVKRRWERFAGVFPSPGGLLHDVAIYERRELYAASSSSILTYGLDHADRGAAAAPAAMFGARPPSDEAELRSRPGVLGPARDWRLISGLEQRPPAWPLERQSQRVGAWLELQYWWRSAFYACGNPGRPWAAYMCVKMIAEPARILLSLAGHRAPDSRPEILRAAAHVIPEEQPAFRRALELMGDLPRLPVAPVAEFFPELSRLSNRVARQLAEEMAGATFTEVRLTGADLSPGEGLVPFADWRAVVVPSLPDESLAPMGGTPASAQSLIEAARRAAPDVQPAAREGELLLLPAVGPWRGGFLRSVQAAFSDPVSFALLSGSETALFPELSGWSARDWARRAVAEHAGWLRRGRSALTEPTRARSREWIDGAGRTTPPLTRALAKLLTALRAGLFLHSLDQGSPTLALRVGAAATELGAMGGDPSGAAAEAAEAYRLARLEHSRPPQPAVEALRAVVLAMPAYAGLRNDP